MAKSKDKLKRPASAPKGPHKKRKLSSQTSTKDKAYERPSIPIPLVESEDDEHDGANLSDQDLDLLAEYGGAASFLSHLDQKGIARSKIETQRLKKLSNPQKEKKPQNVDDLPSIHSGSEDEDQEPWDSEDNLDLTSELSDDDSDEEMPYEKSSRSRRPEPEKSHSSVAGLPIKLANGRVQQTGKVSVGIEDVIPEESSSESEQEYRAPSPPVEDVSTAARFGRIAVVEVLTISSRQKRINAAKDQIADICQDIVSDPENGLGLLRRLHTFSLPIVITPTQPNGVPNDTQVRKLALLSQLAVFKDIVPGYRIRELSDKEKGEKVSQMVARTREYEQGLVHVYQNYLKSLEAEVKTRTELAEMCLQSMCTLLRDVTHFNFRTNLMNCIVAKLSRKAWDDASQLCLSTINHVFQNDIVGLPSLELVQLMNRMIKEKHYNVHPLALSCLLRLRLRNELGVRSSELRADREEAPRKSYKERKGISKGKDAAPHLSKKAKKVVKENKEIEKEFKEAEAVVDKEERANRQTETLKLLFVLYFQILKSPKPTPLLPAALRGISRFAHLVNVDFFKDLLKVLKDLINRDVTNAEESNAVAESEQVQHRLLCIATAFDLLSGQGEVLMIELTEFITALYALILPLSLTPTIDLVSVTTRSSTADLLFRALDVIFNPRTAGTAAPAWRSAAFAKRLLIASLHWPGPVAIRAIQLVKGLVAKDGKLESLLSTEERSFDGVYRAEVDDPQLSNPFVSCFWELHALRLSHADVRVREEAEKLANFER